MGRRHQQQVSQAALPFGPAWGMPFPMMPVPYFPDPSHYYGFSPEYETEAFQENQGSSNVVQPQVISVRKSRDQGYAKVYVRDRSFLDRCVKQSVAIIDGCCCELRAHLKLSRDGEEKMAVFVAWGRRVERKVTISEESLEDYFNKLALTATINAEEPQAPFAEEAQVFQLKSGLDDAPSLEFQPEAVEPSEQLLLEGPFCEAQQVQRLWEAKGALDAIWKMPPPPLARSLMARVARLQLFPNAASANGDNDHENRAGAKLEELASVVGLLEDVPEGSAFFDLCGGPGAWSQYLLGLDKLRLRGFGFTLRTDVGDAEDWKAEDKDQWYPDLLARSDWKALWGADGTGDLLKPGNIEHCAAELRNQRVFLCVADGGFSDDAIPANLQELYFYRLLLAELQMAMSCLEQGGRFVCKLYSTYSTATSALLYLATRCFERVTVVKPRSSRVTGPERYLACFGYKAEASETQMILAALSFSQKLGDGRSPLTMPLLSPVVPAACMEKDSAFLDSLRCATRTLASRQAAALQAVVDRALHLESVATQTSLAMGLSTERAARLTIDTSNTVTAEVLSPSRPRPGARGSSPRRARGHRGHARRERTRAALGKAAGKGAPSSPQKSHRRRL